MKPYGITRPQWVKLWFEKNAFDVYTILYTWPLCDQYKCSTILLKIYVELLKCKIIGAITFLWLWKLIILSGYVFIFCTNNRYNLFYDDRKLTLQIKRYCKHLRCEIAVIRYLYGEMIIILEYSFSLYTCFCNIFLWRWKKTIVKSKWLIFIIHCVIKYASP